MKAKRVLTIAMMCGALAQTSIHADEVNINDLPPSVRVSINGHLKGGSIQKITKTSVGSQTSYAVMMKGQNGGTEYFHVNQNGQYMGITPTQGLYVPTQKGLKPNSKAMGASAPVPKFGSGTGAGQVGATPDAQQQKQQDGAMGAAPRSTAIGGVSGGTGAGVHSTGSGPGTPSGGSGSSR